MSISSGGNSLEPRILVLGLGGAGCNAVNNMISSNLEGLSFCVANTDAQALNTSLATTKIQLGEKLTEGLGAGSDPEIGKRAAEESIEELEKVLKGYHMAFITAGMGGGTGTGAAHVVAQLAKTMGILTVAVVTKPFNFEGARRMQAALNGIAALEPHIDTLLIIPNQNLFRIASNQTTFTDAFKMADNVLDSGIRGITDLVTRPGLINLDFADIRSVMRNMGPAMMGTGEAEGENRALEAVELAISNPLLDHSSMKGAKAVLFNITGSDNLTLFELDEAANRVREEVDPDANIIVGSAFNPELGDKIRISIFATGLDIQTDKYAGQQSSSQAKEASGKNSKSSDTQAPKNSQLSSDTDAKSATASNIDNHQADDIESSQDSDALVSADTKDLNDALDHNAATSINTEHSATTVSSATKNTYSDEAAISQSVNNGAPPFHSQKNKPYSDTHDSKDGKSNFSIDDALLQQNKMKHDENHKKSFLEKMSMGFSKMISGNTTKKSPHQHDQHSIDTPAFIRRNTNHDDEQ